jgi:hypothetical protein
VNHRAIKAAPLDSDALAAWFAGKAPRRLLAIPFDGPIPFPDGRGRDLEGEYFDERTDIKPDWFDARPVLFHHGTDVSGKAGSGLVGKADNLGSQDGQRGIPDEDGWWVDLWLRAGERNAARVKALAERGAQLFGSSAAIPHLVKRGKAGHIEVWPYIEQTITTAPVNRLSAFSMKAAMDDFTDASITVPDVLREVLTELDALRDLRTDLSSDGDVAAKADVDDLDAWMAALRSATASAERLRTQLTR